MPTVREGAIGEDIAGHPELSDLIRIIATGNPLVVANGGPDFVIISAVDMPRQYKFTKQGNGYFVELVQG